MRWQTAAKRRVLGVSGRVTKMGLGRSPWGSAGRVDGFIERISCRMRNTPQAPHLAQPAVVGGLPSDWEPASRSLSPA